MKIVPEISPRHDIDNLFSVSTPTIDIEPKVTVIGTAASRVYFHLKAEAVRMGE